MSKDSIMDSMFGAFGQSVESVKTQEESGGSKLPLFKPDPSSTPNKMWNGIVKFLPNLEELESPMVKKTTYWLTDPTTGKGFLYESPKSLGKYEDCVVASKYWEWKESKDARLVEQSGQLSYSRKCFVLVQVIKDLQDDTNNGNIYLWNVPHKIQKMIDQKMYPTKEDIDMGEVPHNPFDPFNGLTMTLKIGLSEHGRDWDSVVWSKESYPKTMILEGESSPVVLSADATELKAQQQKALETIINAEAKLSSVAYTAPNEAMLTRVNKVLAIMAGEPVNAGQEAPAPAPAPKPVASNPAPSNPAPSNPAPSTASSQVDDDFMDEVMNAGS